MDNGFSLGTFVPLYIFVPIILIGLVEMIRTPAPSNHGRDNTASELKRFGSANAVQR